MDSLSLKEMVAREKAAFAAGITAAALMEAAGQAMAERIAQIYPRARAFLVVVGKGNNGGDGLVVARHLAQAGHRVDVVLAAAEDQLGELPVAVLEKLRKTGAKVTTWSHAVPFPNSDGVVIDALLGIQARGELRGGLADIVARMNAERARLFFRVAALDLPTGLAAYEEGKPKDRDAAIVADVTLAVGFAKDLLLRESLSAWVGRLEIVPWSGEVFSSAPRQALIARELAGLLPRRSAFSYKGDFGKLAIVAGSVGFTGAPVLCAQAAQAIGTGLLSVVTRHDASSIVAAHAPAEAMVSDWPESGEPPQVVTGATAIAIGPGLGNDAETRRMLQAVLAVGCPVLIDADGLNALAKNPGLLREAKGPVVLTPHVGEMARLIGRKFEPDERESIARQFVEEHGVTLVLKGTRTLVTARGESFFVNTTGNPGLSTGGSGDTLSGLIAGLLAQKLAPMDAARLGVWLHGHAADLALLERGCEEGLTPTMLSAHVGAALVSLRTQASERGGLIEVCGGS